MSDVTPESTVEREARRTSFGQVAAEYEAFRPGPPAEAITWLFPDPTETVVDLGAGTGALARLLKPVARRVIAVEPDPAMREALSGLVRGIEVRDGRGEAIPVDDHSVDAVVASSSWHWVDPLAGVAEAARVVKPGGFLAALWSGPDPEGGFLAQAQAALSSDGGNTALAATLTGDLAPTGTTLTVPDGAGFDPVEQRRFGWTLPLTADQLMGLLGTFSWIIVMEEDRRRQVYETANRLLREVLGIDGDITVDVEFMCDVYRARRSG